MSAVNVLLAAVLLMHEGGKTILRPTAADKQIRAARAKLDAFKKGRYACCRKQSCDLCAMRYGKCVCAKNLAEKKQTCGQCLAKWKTQGASLTPPDKALPQSPETAEIAKMLLEAKRVLVKEKRYACCKKGGCDECAFEAECPCGKDLAQGKSVCGTCYHGWHSGEGSFSGIDAASVQLAEMKGMDMGMFVSGTAQLPTQAPMFMTESVARKNWTFQAMGQASLVSTQQSGPRGGDKLYSGNWIMPMAMRNVGPGKLTLRTMFSLEPATVTQGRYPLLFQQGETYRGLPIVDGQHPHNFFMELAAL